MDRIVIATRSSALAIAQADIVSKKLAGLGVRSEFLFVSTKGDRDKTSPLEEIGGDGLFVRSVEDALLCGKADIAVHSAKDLPYTLASGLTIAGVPDEADPRDCLIMKTGLKQDCSPYENSFEGMVIGTSSPRRQLAAQDHFPGCLAMPIRGNVPTRIEKLRAGEYDGIILACAGLDRLEPDLSGLKKRIFEVHEMIPAPCQGLIAAECKASDLELVRLLEKVTERRVRLRFDAERYLFCRLLADCSAAIAVNAKIWGSEGAETIRISAAFEERSCVMTGAADGYTDICDKVLKEIYKDG
ncbi:MAG: hydroxymethylbilane synthase [Firmicutes bacterium]|nr:hydroxymethylbilane synthase [Bacillota bacterium]